MAFDNFGTKAVSSASPGPTTKRCEPQLFLAAIGQVIRLWKALDLGSLNMQFQHDWPWDKKITALLIFFGSKLGKFSLDWALWCASRGINKIFLFQTSTGRTSLQSYRLTELKNAILSRTGRRTKTLRRSKLYQRSLSNGSLRDRHFYFKSAQ